MAASPVLSVATQTASWSPGGRRCSLPLPVEDGLSLLFGCRTAGAVAELLAALFSPSKGFAQGFESGQALGAALKAPPRE